MCKENKPRVMEERHKYMAQRYDLSGAVTTEVTMTRGKPLPVGPVVRLPKGVEKLGTTRLTHSGRHPAPRTVSARLPSAVASPSDDWSPALSGDVDQVSP